MDFFSTNWSVWYCSIVALFSSIANCVRHNFLQFFMEQTNYDGQHDDTHEKPYHEQNLIRNSGPANMKKYKYLVHKKAAGAKLSINQINFTSFPYECYDWRFDKYLHIWILSSKNPFGLRIKNIRRLGATRIRSRKLSWAAMSYTP